MGCFDESVLVSFLAGRASEAERSAIYSHLDQCADCRQWSAEAARSTEGLSGEPRGESLRPAPATIDRFEIAEVIGAGGMGLVYRARDPHLGRWIALKVVRPTASSQKARAHDVMQEARALAKVAHPNVTTIFEVGAFGEGIFLAMELVDGETLRERLALGPLSVIEARDVFIQVARALVAAHDKGVIHGDVKPENILLGRDGRTRLADFGLAMDIEGGLSRDGGGGTRGYLAPERVRGGPPTEASDQYAFSLSLSEAIRGVRGSVEGIAPTWGRLSSLIERGTREEPEKRFPSMRALLDAMEQANPKQGARRRLVASALAVVAVAGLAIALHFGRAASPASARVSGVSGVSAVSAVSAASGGTRPTSVDMGEPGWVLSGGAWDAYAVQRDVQDGRTCWVLQPVRDAAGRYATWMRQVNAERYRGKRIRITGTTKTANATARVDFWGRVQAKESPGDGSGLGGEWHKLPADSEWTSVGMLLDVPLSADRVEYGVGIAGPGRIWLDQAKVEVVGDAPP